MRSDATGRRRLARVAGCLYLALFVLGPFVFLYGKAGALVPGEAAASAANVRALEMDFRVGLVIESVIVLIEIVLASILYVIFKPVHQALSAAAAFGRLGEAVVQGGNLLTSWLALSVVVGGGGLVAFSEAQREAISYLMLEANMFVVLVWGLFFGFHLVLLGWLVWASRFLPRWIGALVVVAGLGYLTQSWGMIVWPQYKSALDTAVVVMAVPGELALALWLLVKGIGSSDVPEHQDAG